MLLLHSPLPEKRDINVREYSFNLNTRFFSNKINFRLQCCRLQCCVDMGHAILSTREALKEEERKKQCLQMKFLFTHIRIYF